MTLFSWTSALATGNAFMDAEHHILVERVNAVLEAISLGRSKHAVIGALVDLADYTREHFAQEENQMQRIQYVGILEHSAEHQQLIHQIEALKGNLESDLAVDVMEHYSFLTRWVKDHIMQVDTQLALALNACAASASHAE